MRLCSWRYICQRGSQVIHHRCAATHDSPAYRQAEDVAPNTAQIKGTQWEGPEYIAAAMKDFEKNAKRKVMNLRSLFNTDLLIPLRVVQGHGFLLLRQVG